MMEWLNRKDREPDLKDGAILVFGDCGYPHVAFRDYDEWCHSSHCGQNREHLSGTEIKFTYWMPLPKPPEE